VRWLIVISNITVRWLFEVPLYTIEWGPAESTSRVREVVIVSLKA
jgi:hypothetical protein